MTSVAEAQTRPFAKQEARIAANFALFDQYVSRAEALFAEGDFKTAAAYCSIAAHIPVQNHCGIFWSPRVEKVLTDIARATETPGPKHPRPKQYKRILSVMTQAAPVGGLTRMLCQWVGADSGREHSMVLTQHRGPTPQFVYDAFAASGGSVRHLNRSPGGQIAWAREVRTIAQDYDLVVLHTHCEDVVPLLAFGAIESGKYPHVVVLNHADHLFWLNPSIAHLNIDLRDAALELSVTRRGIARERNILMPTISESIKRKRTRDEAKRELGIAPETILMVSCARQLKYLTRDGASYADIHAPILEKHSNVSLIVVGGSEQPDWAPHFAKFGDRLQSIEPTPNPRIYYEAADIYVDSYPFVSSTSMMEASGHGTPAVSIFTHPDDVRITAINHFALVGNTWQARSFDEYRAMLEKLIADPVLRENMGRTAGEAVAAAHNPPGWNAWMEAVYARAAELEPLDNRGMLAAKDQPNLGELDVRHEDLFGGNWPIEQYVKSYIGVMPFGQRLAHWRELQRKGMFKSPRRSPAFLLPEWLKRAVRDGMFNMPEDPH
jgi:hypothetical protein